MRSVNLKGLVVDDYELIGLIGLGGTSIVLSAKSRSFQATLGVEHRVALKIMFERARAQEEAMRLIRMSGVHGVNAIQSYFEVSSGEFFDVIKPLIQDWASNNNQKTDLGYDKAYVLVLHLEKGDTLTKTRPWTKRDGQLPSKGKWIIETADQKLVQYLRFDFSQREKVALVEGLIASIQNTHNLFNQVHGDLHPGNVVFDRSTLEVSIIDWSNDGVFGADGWLSPWHDRLILGEIEALPKAADIHLLALWVVRLLGEGQPKWQRFAKSILEEDDEAKVPSIDAFIESFNKTLKEVEIAKATRSIWKTVALFFTVALLLFLGLVDWKRLILKRHINDIKAQAFASSENEQYLKDLKSLLDDKRYYGLNKEIISSIGEINLRKLLPTDLAQNLDFTKPSAVFSADDQSFVLYKSAIYFLGSAINETEYIFDIDAVGMVIAGRSSNYRFIPFSEHKLASEANEEGCLLIYESKLSELLAALGSIAHKEIKFTSTTEPQVFGLLKGKTTIELLKKLYLLMDSPWDARDLRCSYEKNWLRLWEVEPGYELQGDLRQIVVEILGEKLGYGIEDITPYFDPTPQSYVCINGDQMLDNISIFLASEPFRFFIDPCNESFRLTTI